MINFGYACLATTIEDTQMKSCTMRTSTPERLRDIISHNLDALLRLVQYNQKNNIHLFRISSDLIPFGSSPVNTLAWQEEFADRFTEIGNAISAADLRVSMHPGQYTVLNSPDVNVVSRAIADLEYHEQVLRLLNTATTSKIILHVGGVYNDKAAAMERFCHNWERVSDRVRSRIVLENDERFYNISDVLNIAGRLGVPAVFDTLHHTINPIDGESSLSDWILVCAKTWKDHDGTQKIHYSQQSVNARRGAHSKTIYAAELLPFYETVKAMNLDIMLEVKDKNLSAIKCSLLVSESGRILQLEQEWAKYKYSVLAHSPEDYQAIRELLKDKSRYPVKQFYNLIEHALDAPIQRNNAVNALLHIWGYFNQVAESGEKKRFFATLEKYQSGMVKEAAVKHQLLKLAQKYNEAYILQSYYLLD